MEKFKGEIKEVREILAVRALILNEGKVLIIRESANYEEGSNPGRYDLPGGRVNFGEDSVTALAREVKEECGLVVNIGDPIFTGYWSPIVEGTPLHIKGEFFICQIDGVPEVVLSKDHNQYVWIYPEDYEKYNIISPNDQAIKNLIRT